MSWITLIWTAIASACLTLAAVHWMVWWKDRRGLAHLLFALAAVSTVGLAVAELAMMRAQSSAAYGAALRWLHVPAWAGVLTLVGFVRVYLGTGRPWLAWTICGVRTLSLALNFAFDPNLNYLEITGLKWIRFLGEQVPTAVGRSNPWMLVGQFSLLLLVVFVADAAMAAWRRGERRRALMIGGSILLYLSVATTQAVLFLWGIIEAPLAVSVFFLGTIATMGYELSRDILRAAQLSEELGRSQEGMKLAAAAAKLALWTYDLRTGRIWITGEGRKLYGLEAGREFTRDQFLDAIHADDRDQVEAILQRSLSADGLYQSDYRVPQTGGGVRWISARGKVDFNDDGEAVRMRGVSMDITDRKQAELEVQRHRDAAAHLSRVTTLGEISGSLAHELNQPLTAILANTEAAELHLSGPTPDLDEVRSILADIRTDDLRAGEIIHGMRAFLRQRQLKREPLRVDRLIEGAIRLVNADATSRGMTFQVEVPAGLPDAWGDHIHLQQVLLNLLVNAMDAAHDCDLKDRRIHVGARLVDSTVVEVTVTDSGAGLPADTLATVFQPFHTTKPAGLGLGLAICRSIVEAHGGTIGLANNAGRGATARFTVPVSAQRQSGKIPDSDVSTEGMPCTWDEGHPVHR